MKVSVVIPARLASTRLPEKALADIFGISMIMRVYKQVMQASLVHEVIIATDHKKIFDHVSRHGGNVVMTSDIHTSGTDRIGEVALQLNSDIIINVQGDEPLINPIQINELVSFMQDRKVMIATQCQKITQPDVLFDYNVVKVVRDKNDKALYFSRQAVPAFRDDSYAKWIEKSDYYRHIGMYGFDREVLLQLNKLPQSTYEKAESLEQLRWLQNGYDIYCIETQHKSIGVDTEDDLEKVRELVFTKTFH